MTAATPRTAAVKMIIWALLVLSPIYEACSSERPRSSISFLIRNSTIKATATHAATTGSLLSVTAPKLPIVQNSIAAISFSLSAITFRSIIKALESADTIIPARIYVDVRYFPVSLTRMSTNAMASMAPANAPNTTPPIPPIPITVITATPAVAPEEIPSISGEASWFLNTIWNPPPLTPSITPARAAIISLGSLSFKMTFIFIVSSHLPVKISRISLRETG